MTKYTNAQKDFKVNENQIREATKEYNKRKESIILSIEDKLVFVGMGMDFKPKDKNHISNHRIRTSFLNNEGVLCFVGFGTNRDQNLLRCDHAIKNTKKNNSEWKSLRERENTEERLNLERIKEEIPYTKENVLKLVNDWFNCDFEELEVYSYFINTDDYICKGGLKK